MTAPELELDEALEGLEVHDRSDAQRWSGVEVRGYVTPELEVLTRAKGGDGRTVTGILVPYGREQQITPTMREMIRRGAAIHQINTPRRMKFAREHLKFGGTLIGRAHELRDDAAGLWGALRAAPTPAGDEALTLVEEGALDELSIGFRAVRDKHHADGLIERVRIDVMETALVVQGAYGRAARVTGLRSADAPPDEDETTEDTDPEQMNRAALDLVLARHRIVIS
jgi:HK97 family phage prohead protease